MEVREIPGLEFGSAQEAMFAPLVPVIEGFAAENDLALSRVFDRDPINSYACYFMEWPKSKRWPCHIRICARDAVSQGTGSQGTGFQIDANGRRRRVQTWDYDGSEGPDRLWTIFVDARSAIDQDSQETEPPQAIRRPAGQPPSVFMYAAMAGKVELLAALLDEGLDVNVRAGREMTALHWAASAGQLEAARFLLEHGAWGNARDNVGITPLMEAVCNGHVEIVALLLAAGTDVSLRAQETLKAYWRAGKTALGMARHSEYLLTLDEGLRQQRLITLLQGAGAVD